VAGTMLVSTDLRALRAGLDRRPPGLPLAIVSAFMFGLGGFLLGYLVQRSGDWVVALWASRLSLLIVLLPFIASRRAQFVSVRSAGLLALGFAVATGLADFIGVTSYSAGAEAGYISIVIAGSAVFPVVAVALSVQLLRERLVRNQVAGVALVVAGLLMLGVGSS
jgi:drug/metabolite transporter (DMT)-like permease